MSYYPATLLYIFVGLWFGIAAYQGAKQLRQKYIRKQQDRRRAEHIQLTERYRRGL